MKENNGSKIFLALIILVCARFFIFHGLMAAGARQIDLPSFYYSANAAFGEHISPYNPGALAPYAARTGQAVNPYLYPPPSLLVFLPLTLMTYGQASVLSFIANHALLIFIAFMLGILVMRFKPLSAEFAFLCLYMSFFYPAVNNIEMGQVNLFITALMLSGWYLYRDKGNKAAAGILFAAASIIKIYPLFFLLYFAVKKEFRLLGWFLGSLAFLCIASLPFLPAGSWSSWYTQVALTGGYASATAGLLPSAAPWNISVNGFTSRLFMENGFARPLLVNNALAVLMPYVISLLITVVTFLSIFRARNTGNTDLAVVLAAMFMVSPVSGQLHLIFVLPAIFIFLQRAFDTENTVYLAAAIIAAAFIALPFPFLSPVFSKGLMTLFISSKLFVLFWIWLELLKKRS